MAEKVHAETGKIKVDDGSVSKVHVEVDKVSLAEQDSPKFLKAAQESAERLAKLARGRNEADIPASDPYWSELEIHRQAYQNFKLAEGTVSGTKLEKTTVEANKPNQPTRPGAGVDNTLPTPPPVVDNTLPTPPVHPSTGPLPVPGHPSGQPVPTPGHPDNELPNAPVKPDNTLPPTMGPKK